MEYGSTCNYLLGLEGGSMPVRWTYSACIALPALYIDVEVERIRVD